VLASRQDPFDPMEKAIRQYGEQHLGGAQSLYEDWSLVREYPLSPELLALSHVWRSPEGDSAIVAAKGAPEAITDLCHLSDEQRRAVLTTVAELAADGLRVLGVAAGPLASNTLPAQQHDIEFEFLGLIGLADPIRAAVPGAIRECHTAGIRVIMITGDYPGTAQNIARQIGLNTNGRVITGPELNQMGDDELAKRIRGVEVFARVVPEQKLRIVNALKASGEIVAMTGDGVNDAPALKSAHIGVAMGGRGTDVARESAALVLLDDDFNSIVDAVRLGRRIFDNIKKAVSYIFAIHVPIAGLSLIPVFIPGWPLILLPVHIVFLELIIDPSCSLIFEAEGAERNVMHRPPRRPQDRLFSLRSVGVSLLQGFSVLAVVFGAYVLARYLGHSENNARGLTFATLVTANLALILTNRSWSRTILSMFKEPNAALKWVLCGAAASLVLVFSVPVLRGLFRFDVPHLGDVAICLAAGAISIAWFELLKMFGGGHPQVVSGAAKKLTQQ
jgi:Ca2+-transporting ATPase